MPTSNQTSGGLLDQPPTKIALPGRYKLSYWYDSRGNPRTFACRTISVSPFQMALSVTVVGKVGDSIMSNFPDLGKLDGSISNTFSGGFIFEPNLSRLERERVANKLIWLERKRRDPSIRDARKHERFAP